MYPMVETTSIVFVKKFVSLQLILGCQLCHTLLGYESKPLFFR